MCGVGVGQGRAGRQQASIGQTVLWLSGGVGSGMLAVKNRRQQQEKRNLPRNSCLLPTRPPSHVTDQSWCLPSESTLTTTHCPCFCYMLPRAAAVVVHPQAFLGALSWFEGTALSRHPSGPYLLGDSFSLLDIMTISSMERLAAGG